MDIFKVNATKSTPLVDFNPQTGILAMSGRLISPSNQEFIFFTPIFDWLKLYALAPASETRFISELEYCSSSGIKNLFKVFKMLDEMFADGLNVSIEWNFYSDDDDSKEKGVQFSNLLKLPFRLVEQEPR